MQQNYTILLGATIGVGSNNQADDFGELESWEILGGTHGINELPPSSDKI